MRQFVLQYLKTVGWPPDQVHMQRLRGDGSKRLFWRINRPQSSSSFIAMANPPVDKASERENFAYVMIGRHLRRKGVPVPEIYQHDLSAGWFVMEDMGSTSLQELVSSLDDPLALYEELLHHLFRLQLKGAVGFDTRWCCQTKRYDSTVMRKYETDYFRKAFLCRYLDLGRDWPQLERPFQHLAVTASEADGVFFLHRDFQSRNIIVADGNLGIVDWQGGRLGPLGYDLASLVIDPYPPLSPEQRKEVYDRYLLLLEKHEPVWVHSFKRYYPYLAILRNLQILGAFSYLTQVRNKPHFEVYIPKALDSLEGLLFAVHDQSLSPLRTLVTDIKSHHKILDKSKSHK